MTHREASKLAAQSTCRVCQRHGCVPAHWPRHRGSGGRFENDWDQEHWIPLCPECHSLVDGRLGVSRGVEYRRQKAIEMIESKQAKASARREPPEA
jgi:hypothetical protein